MRQTQNLRMMQITKIVKAYNGVLLLCAFVQKIRIKKPDIVQQNLACTMGNERQTAKADVNLGMNNDSLLSHEVTF